MECKTVNLAKASVLNSLKDYFRNVMEKEKTDYQEQKDFSIDCVLANGGASTTSTYAIHHDYYKDFLITY